MATEYTTKSETAMQIVWQALTVLSRTGKAGSGYAEIDMAIRDHDIGQLERAIEVLDAARDELLELGQAAEERG